MTYEEREAIFAKEVLDLDDVMKLFDISRNEASRLMNAIRLKLGDRLGIKGKLHVEDYLLYFDISSADRYSRKKKERKETESKTAPRRTAKPHAVAAPLIKSSDFNI